METNKPERHNVSDTDRKNYRHNPNEKDANVQGVQSKPGEDSPRVAPPSDAYSQHPEAVIAAGNTHNAPPSVTLPKNTDRFGNVIDDANVQRSADSVTTHPRVDAMKTSFKTAEQEKQEREATALSGALGVHPTDQKTTADKEASQRQR